jgi:NAD(P)-dependent dehydrogenase (short-subunit alcohol dehydrogenase family)
MLRVLLITGAASGIGAAVARLAPDATPLVLVDRDEPAVLALAAELEGTGRRAIAVGADVREADDVARAFVAAATLGDLGGVVASAGIDRGGLLHELPAASWDDVIAVNLRGAFLTCQAAVRAMRGAGGSIVCVSSPLGQVAVPGGAAAYSASKAGIGALVRSAAVDYGRDGIRVNAVLPGPTETALMWAAVAPGEVAAMRDTVAAEVPLGRLADPGEPARAALWLLSDDASYVTGSQLACDGGVLAKASVTV